MPQVPDSGEFLVRNGKVLKILETDYQGPDSSGENETYVCYTEREDDEE